MNKYNIKLSHIYIYIYENKKKIIKQNFNSIHKNVCFKLI